VRIIHRALDAGINVLDTADIYSDGESEEIVGKAVKGRRDDLVIATKFGFPMGEDPNRRGGSRRWINRAVDNSLRRLDTDHIDLYQMHRPDPDTDIAETLAALTDLVRTGKIRAFGSSMFPAEQISEARWTAKEQGSYRFLTEQPMYSVFTRRPEAAVFPTTQRHGLGVFTFSPLNGGWLSGTHDPRSRRRAAAQPSNFDPTTPTGQAKDAARSELNKLAQDAGLTLPQLAIAFAGSHPAVTSVLIGPRTADQLEGLLTAADIELTADILDRIDEIVPPGIDLNPADNYAAAPAALLDKRLRRRQT